MSKEKMRAEFEVWAVSEGYAVNRTISGHYIYAVTSAAWNAWQASRVSLREDDRWIPTNGMKPDLPDNTEVEITYRDGDTSIGLVNDWRWTWIGKPGDITHYRMYDPEPDVQREPVGEAGSLPGAKGFTTAIFDSRKVPVGTKLYTAPQLTFCVGCEGTPAPENSPCAVCGQKSIQDELSDYDRGFRDGKLDRLIDEVVTESALVEALECLYNAIDSCIELTPDIMRKANAALDAYHKGGE